MAPNATVVMTNATRHWHAMAGETITAPSEVLVQGSVAVKDGTNLVSAPDNQNIAGEWSLRFRAVGPSALQRLGPYVVRNDVGGTDKVVNAEVSPLGFAMDSFNVAE